MTGGSPPRLVVVGGGPAGLSAAAEAQRFGVAVTLVDEGARLGGQYFRARQHATDGGSPRWFASEGAVVDVRSATTVVDASADHLVTWHPDRRLEELEFDWLVLATGGYDRPVAIPGWTLPGVLTAGGAHTLAKLHSVTPGRRLMVAGAGPFILAVADVLARSGCRVMTVEATGFGTQLRALPALLRDPALLGQAAGYMARLIARRSVPRYGRTIVEILGGERVEAAVIQRVDRDWRPIPGTAETIEADGVVLGFGFVPRLDLAQLLELEVRYRPDSSDYEVVVDATMASSRPGIFAAGETTGIAGARAAHVEGRLAGLSVAALAGLVDAGAHELHASALRRQLRRLHRTAEWLRATYRPRPALWALATSSTSLCRCEDIPIAAATRAAATTSPDPLSIKAATRIGMGLCQGRTCSPYLIEWLRANSGYVPPLAGRPWRVRPPLAPVPLGDIAAGTNAGQTTPASSASTERTISC